MAISYSDGVEIEEQIIRILRSQERPFSSQDRLKSADYGHWPLRYHLSPERSHLLRPFCFQGLKVLELGAGMGALSRFLAEQAEQLVVVEGTQKRFEALSERLRDLKNWSGTICNIQDFKTDERFDVVCVPGVLEYAELYIAPRGELNAFEVFLAHASSFLKPDGVLMIAIENKMGLKYWGGAPEDHTDRPYDGLTGYGSGKTPKTFSRHELKTLLNAQGFLHIDEYFPFPDYKIPSCVVSGEFLNSAPTGAAELICTKPFETYGRHPRVTPFPDLLVCEQLLKAQLMADLSNSFLFFGSRDEASHVRKKVLQKSFNGEVAWHYSHRHRFSAETTVQKRASGYQVTKSLSKPHMGGRAEWIHQGVHPWIEGSHLRTVLLDFIYRRHWTPYLDLFTSFLTFAISTYKISNEKIDRRACDAIFNNCVQTSRGFEFFDLEWAWKQDFSPSWLVFRNVYQVERDAYAFEHVPPFESLKSLYETLCHRLNLAPDFEADLATEAQFQHEVFGQEVRVCESYIREIFEMSMRRRILLRRLKTQLAGTKLYRPIKKLKALLNEW